MPDAATYRLIDAPGVSEREVQVVFDHWRVATERKATTVLTPARRRLIKLALRRYPLQDVLDAISGWRLDPWLSGRNPRNEVFNDLSVLLKPNWIERLRDRQRKVSEFERLGQLSEDQW